MKQLHIYIFLSTLFTCISCNNQSRKFESEKNTVESTAQALDTTELSKSKEKARTNSESPAPITNIGGNESQNGCPYELQMAKLGLVNIKDVDPSILVELKYSTPDNFVGADVYGCLDECFLQKKAALMLANASKYLQSKHDSLRLLVYDGARPLAIQWELWNALPQYAPSIRKNYVANPGEEGSIHNYGSAVDLTLATQTGIPLDMGTKYDFFGELAYPKYELRLLKEGKLTEKQIENRKILRSAMQAAGFAPIEYEWWHFNAVSRSKAKQMYQLIQ